ncbi:MAG: arabinan endo-1,5-alpha-L-arabinosidase [Polyangiaceae bacterium]
MISRTRFLLQNGSWFALVGSLLACSASPSTSPGTGGSGNPSGGSGNGGTSSAGGSQNGGSQAGGSTSGGATSGGSSASSGGAQSSNGGSAGSSGGNNAAGGSASASGGSNSGGGSSGGATSGAGGSSGGNVSGGATSRGGATSGGTAAGGTSSGGASSGGRANSGGATSTGGASSGGTTASGGASSGGTTSTGGAAGDLCDVGVYSGTKPTPLTLSGNTFAHDPTMIEDNGTFYRFWTGNYIPIAKSTNLTNWTDAGTVYKNAYPSWVSTWLAGIPNQTFGFPWAPDVSKFNGQFHIYSTFSAVFGDNISCITHLTTPSIAQNNWTDQGTVICTKGSENYNAIDADAAVDTAGIPWLAFGSFWNGIMGIKLNADGSRAGTDMTRLAWASEIEGPVLFRRCGYYYLFVSWGLCCPGEGRSVSQLTYRVAVGRSTNIMGPYVDKNGVQMVNGGGSIVVQGDGVTWQAAGHSDVMVSGNKIYHLYHAYRKSDGGAQLRIVEMPFDSSGWPVPAGP